MLADHCEDYLAINFAGCAAFGQRKIVWIDLSHEFVWYLDKIFIRSDGNRLSGSKYRIFSVADAGLQSNHLKFFLNLLEPLT